MRLFNSIRGVLELGAFALWAAAGAREPFSILEHVPTQKALAGGGHEFPAGRRNRARHMRQVIVNLLLLYAQGLRKIARVQLPLAQKR